MNPLEKIRNDILNEKVSLTSILRNAKVIASSLKNDDLIDWINLELRGYHDIDVKNIPNYRILDAPNFGSFSGAFGSGLKDFPIPIAVLPKYAQEELEQTILRECIREYESLVESKSSIYHIEWSPDMIASIQNDVTIYQNMTLYHAYQKISRGTMVGVLDSIRNNLLDFILQLEKEYPELTKTEEDIKKIPTENVSNIFHTNIFGSSHIITTGTNIKQEYDVKVIRNDLESLLKYFEKINIPKAELDDLDKAIKKDDKIDGKRFGKNVATWISEITKKIATGTLDLAINKIPGLILKALSQYYGIDN